MNWHVIDHFGYGMLAGVLYQGFWSWYAPKLVRAFTKQRSEKP